METNKPRGFGRNVLEFLWIIAFLFSLLYWGNILFGGRPPDEAMENLPTWFKIMLYTILNPILLLLLRSIDKHG